MKKRFLLLLTLALVLSSSGCSKESSTSAKKRITIGIMLSDAGLGDQSFSDAGFAGLEKARDELGISFDYRELKDTGTYEKGLEELTKQGNDLVIGLGFSMQEAVDKTAKKYPKQSFLLIDSVSDLANVNSVTFKEEEGSFLIGVIAGMKTKSNVVGFIGGVDVPLIRKFESGFSKGVKAVNPDAEILSTFAGSFGDDKLGMMLAKEMIAAKADYIFPAAGFTGVGVLNQAQQSGIYTFGVDTDQFFLAEKAVASSMLKRVDVAIFNAAKELADNGKISGKHTELGVKEGGVDIAPIRVISLTADEQAKLDSFKEKVSANKIQLLP